MRTIPPLRASVASAAVAASILFGCVDGSAPPSAPSDTRDASEPADVDPLADVDTRTADGAYACGMFPDTCPDGYSCYARRSGDDVERECLRHGSQTPIGDACPEDRSGRCGQERRCLKGTCRRICDPNDPSKFGCASRSVCLAVDADGVALGWGVCERRADRCTLWPDDSCPGGENCYELEQGKRCRSYDKRARVGDACGSSTECNAEQICVRPQGSGEKEGTCRQKCNEEHPCDDGECKSTSKSGAGACFGADGGG